MKIKHVQGNVLLKLLGAGIVFPEKLGKEEFDPAQRAFANDEIRAFRKVLMSYTELWALKRKALFGQASNWKQTSASADSWELVDQDLEIEIKMDDEAERGLFWVLLLIIHPGSPFQLGVETQDDTAWPMVEQLGYRSEIRDMIGLSQRKPVRQIRKDSDPSWNQKKNLRKVELDEPAAPPAAKPEPKAAEAAG